MNKLNPDELRQVGAELDQVIQGHHDLLDAEPKIKKNIEDARDEAQRKYKDITEYQ